MNARKFVPATCLSLLLGLIAAADPVFPIEGSVTGPHGDPIPNTRVWLVLHNEVRSMETGDTGAFSFAGCPPGPFELAVFAEGYAAGGYAAQLIGPAEIDVFLAEPVDLLLRITDAAYQPLEGAFLRYLIINGDFPIALERLAPHGFPAPLTDANGMLAIPFVPKGAQVSFAAGHSRFADTFVPALMPTDFHRTIPLYPGEILRGRVVGPQGEGAESARVALFRQDTHGNEVPRDLLTGPDGFYHAQVRPGRYIVRATHPDFGPSRPEPVQVLRHRTAIADLSLPEACFIRGRILAEDGGPLGGVPVIYEMHDELFQQTVTLESGHYQLRVAHGRGRLRVLPPEGLMMDRMADPAVEMTTVREVEMPDLRLVPLPRVTGRIRMPDSSETGPILLSSQDLTPPSWIVTQPNGSFTLTFSREPLDGDAHFDAEHARRFLRAPFAIDFGAVEEINLTLEAYSPAIEPNIADRAPNDLSAYVGIEAPPLACEDWIVGPPTTLNDLRGKIVVLTFWAGFAQEGPLADRMNHLRALHKLLAGVDDVAFLAVHDSAVTREQAAQYANRFQISFPLAYDNPDSETFRRYQIKQAPQTLLIGREGKVRYFDVDGRILELIKALRR